MTHTEGLPISFKLNERFFERYPEKGFAIKRSSCAPPSLTIANDPYIDMGWLSKQLLASSISYPEKKIF